MVAGVYRSAAFQISFGKKDVSGLGLLVVMGGEEKGKTVI